MNKHTQYLKRLLLSDIDRYIAQGVKLDELSHLARSLCYSYFPYCSEVMCNIVENYAISKQQYFYSLEDLETELRER